MKKHLFRRICCAAAAAVTMAAALPLQTFAAEKTLPSGKKESELSSLIEGFWKDHESTAAGMAAAVFNSDEELYAGYFGCVNKEKNLPVTEDSVIEWGSVSKLTVWVSVMQLSEQGKIDLTADVRQYLPEHFFKHLKYDDPITMMNLMNHNAGFEETAIGMETTTEANIVSLEDYITSTQPCQIWKPGETVAYSNWGATLAAYIVQRVSGMPYYQYARKTFSSRSAWSILRSMPIFPIILPSRKSAKSWRAICRPVSFSRIPFRISSCIRSVCVPQRSRISRHSRRHCLQRIPVS